MSLLSMDLKDASTVASVSAVTKQQLANAPILFGKNSTLIVQRLDALVKIKELDTTKLSSILDLLSDEAATAALASKVAGKNLVKAVVVLYKAKSLVATINALRAIRIKPTDPNAVAAPARLTKKPAPAVDVPATFSPTFTDLRAQHARDYSQEFIRAVEPVSGAGKFVSATKKAFVFTYKKLTVDVTLTQRGWKIIFTGDHLAQPRHALIPVAGLGSIKNVLKIFGNKDVTDAQIAAAAKKG